MRKLLSMKLGVLCLMLMAVFSANAESVTAKWDFKNNIPAGIRDVTNFQGNEGDIESDVPGIIMHVDAKSGKLYCVGRDNAQMNPGTVLQVPVFSTKDVVTVEGFSGYSHFAVGGEENGSEDVVAHTATAAEVKQGFVEVTATAGNNYIYCVTVVIAKMPAKDVIGTWDYSNSTVMNQTMALSGSTTEGGVNAIENNGLVMIVAANGKTFRNNDQSIQIRKGAVFKVPVKSTEDIVTVFGFPSYSYYTIGSSTEEITNTNSNPSTTYKAKNSDVAQGYVAITSTNDNNYYLKITVLQKAPAEKEVLENVSAVATFPFNLGTEGQKADFGENADYFINSKVTYGEKLTLKGLSNKSGLNQTYFDPNERINSATADNAVKFLIQPNYGLTFTPVSVAFKTTRYGTDNGLIDVAWINPDGTTVELAKGVKPNRDSGKNPANSDESGLKYSSLSYDVEGATPAEGTCGLQINIHSLQNGKQIGFCDIVITGLLNGQEVEVPILGGFSANGEEYVADNVFEGYEGTIEISKAKEMISASNPLTNVTAITGEIGEITYSGDNTQCDVTIPIILGTVAVDYVVHFVQKPDFMLTYYNTDNTVMGTQAVEKDAPIRAFEVDYTVAIAKEGYKVRGWFVNPAGGQKYTTADIVTKDLNLYAFASEIEEPSDFKKYNFDLTSNLFYPEDHEAFVPVGTGYWHDVQHGWAFHNNDRIELLVGKKANISLATCKYGDKTAELVFKKADGTEITRIPAVSEGDGEISTVQYDGEEGKVYVDVESSGEIYIHNIRIVNCNQINYANQGNWYFVTPGNAQSLLEVIDIVNGINSDKNAERSYIFLPDGTYDLEFTTLTAISGHNISLIGQSMENTIIKNAPHYTNEGIGTTATLLNSGQNLYIQDITLKNELDYYSAGSAGRAVCFQDRGDRAIFKYVTMLSYQDTYYSQNTKQSYWEDCDVHGTVDFLCGGGDVRFQNTTLSLEPRSKNLTGGRTICAPTTTTDFGYVFDNCKVVDLANGQGDWNFGRTWQNDPIAVYLNTTLDDNAANTLISSRWIEKGMNTRDPKVFGEYGTKNAAGDNITPASNIITSYKGQFETILTAEQADAYAYDKMFTNWDPASLTIQKDAPNASYKDGVVTWEPVEGAIAYAVFKNGEFVAVVEDGNSYPIEIGDGDELTIRSANTMGGFGQESKVELTKSLLLDENLENEIPEEGSFINEVSTNRTLKGGIWNTFCLPFEVSENVLAAEPFNGAVVMELSGASFDDAANSQDITFTQVTAMEAGKPYVIKVDADVVNPIFYDVTIGAKEPIMVSAGNCKMVGVYSPYDFAAADENIFILTAANKFSYIGQAGTMKGMRAFFDLNGADPSSNIVMTFNGLDGITTINADNNTRGRIYDLQGRQLNSVPQKGIYIMNGQKFVK